MYRVKHLRLSNFRSVLDMLGDDGADADAGEATPHSAGYDTGGTWRSSDQVQYAFDGMARAGGSAALDRVAMLYGENPATLREAPQIMHPKRSVAEELALHAGLSVADLHRIRRDFALRNHPDRVPRWQHDEATQRMTLANVLIDRALRRKMTQGR